MGLLFARFRPALVAEPTVPVLVIPEKRKRKSEKEQADSDETLCKRMKITGTYIYHKLFREGEGSDIQVNMFGIDWNLHRLYIQQCGYFKSMFSGSWTENRQKRVTVELVDTNITIDALHMTLGCLYFGERDVTTSNVVNVLATALFLQIPDLVNYCEQIMIDNINLETVMYFYIASSDYCLLEATVSCYKWLLLNLTTAFKERKYLLKLSPSLLHELLMDDKLFVINCEMSLYFLLRDWLFHHIHKNVDDMEITSTPESYFRNAKQPFHELLDSNLVAADKSVTIADITLLLRVSDLLMTTRDAQTVLEDGIISEQLLFKQGFLNFQQLMFINQRMYRGLWLPADTQVFEKFCTRLGRLVKENKNSLWRWNGFKYGLGLTMSLVDGSLQLTWDNSGRYGVIVDKQSKRKFIYQLSYTSINPQLQPIHTVYLPRKYITLFPNKEVTMTDLPPATTFPLVVSLKYCITTYTQVTKMMRDCSPTEQPTE